jgi:hypothetical protein
MLGWTCTDYTVVTQPVAEPIATSQAIDYIRASASEQTLVAMLVSSSRVDLEKRLGRALAQQTIRGLYQFVFAERALVASIAFREVPLFLPPVQSIVLVEGQQDPDTWASYTSSPSNWHLEGNLLLLDDMSLIQPIDGAANLRVTAVVGPAQLDAADTLMLLQYVAHRYLYREDDELPEGVRHSLIRNKEWRL